MHSAMRSTRRTVWATPLISTGPPASGEVIPSLVPLEADHRRQYIRARQHRSRRRRPSAGAGGRVETTGEPEDDRRRDAKDRPGPGPFGPFGRGRVWRPPRLDPVAAGDDVVVVPLV